MGANGKSAAAALAGAARPAATPAVSAKVVPTASAVVASSGTASRPATATAARPAAVAVKSTPSKDEIASAPGPSLEFLKWLSDSLKGLNNSVNRTCPCVLASVHVSSCVSLQVEEITSMLLSFPLDPDPSTVEIKIGRAHV